ncbi:MAG: Glycosyl transferase, family 39 [Candidatus Moranbacteria bacterium GW2011_GWE1_49_15]|nr:MAG: Glycosyl transferase, family 39 [Candidatus Moranbacteria bacterium GW2011_GWE2_47_10]KKW07492.1 MAG: Glycosyl transferase, family 39 [Candidatus Moranbacteria bacterium GW2011_GWE1_49_15]HBP01270.1 hypothetical protein [Candidatus Moranbacteria bacterium]
MKIQDFLERHYKKIAFAILSLFFVVSALNANNDSATFDEVAHIPAGYSYLTQHDTRLNPEHPPLIKDLSALPLVFMDLNFDTSEKFWTGELPNLWDEGQWAAGRHLLYGAGNDPDKIIFWSRLPIVILSVLLGLFLFRWGKEIAGPLAGLFALTLYAFDPNILGHNHFVTTDIGIAAFLTFAFYYFLKFLKTPSWKNVALGGIFMGLLLVSKFSSIVALPVFGAIMFVYALVRNNTASAVTAWTDRVMSLLKYSLKSLAAFIVAAAVVWVVYQANTFEMPKETLAKTIEFFFSAEDGNPKTIYTNKTLHALNESDLTRPWSAYLLGPAWVFKRVSGGNGAYFLGQVGNGFTWYFPVVFLIKETLPFLLLAIFSLGYTAKQTAQTLSYAKLNFGRTREKLADFFRKSLVGYTLFGFIILYAFLSIKGGLNIGFRHLFPILPFAYILITKKVFEFLSESHLKTRHVFAIIIGILLAWQIATTAFAYPSFTSYFNETVGGPKNGYHYVTDSNTDWGQDLKRLRKYLDEHPEIDKIRVDYFGGGDIFRTVGEDKAILWWDSKRPIENGWYALSTNYMQGSIYSETKTAEDSYRWTLEYEPVDMIGASILIYHVTDIE